MDQQSLKKHALAQAMLWHELKKTRQQDHCFCRQHYLGRYIVDFFCQDLGLAIEIGSSQQTIEREERRKQRYLESCGVKFLKVTDLDVKRNIRGVLQRIDQCIAEMK